MATSRARQPGFMLTEKDDWKGPTMVVGFGVGFTASAGIMKYN